MANLADVKVGVAADLRLQQTEAGQYEVVGQATLQWPNGQAVVLPVQIPVAPASLTEPVGA